MDQRAYRKHGHGKGGRKALSPEGERRLVADREAGMSYPALGARYGVHPKTARNVCLRLIGEVAPAGHDGEGR